MHWILLCIKLLNVCMWNVHNVNTLYCVYDVMHYNALVINYETWLNIVILYIRLSYN
jgi:hypothetical protein